MGNIRAHGIWLLAVLIAVVSPGLSMLPVDLDSLDTIIRLSAILLPAALIAGRYVLALMLTALGPLAHERIFARALPLMAKLWWLHPEAYSQQRSRLSSS